MKREGYHTASAVLVNRNIRIDPTTDEAIRLIAARDGKPWGTVAREMLALAAESGGISHVS